MFDQIQNPMMSFNKNFAETMLKMNGLAFETATRAIDVQIKTIENRWNATQAFLAQATEVTNMDDVKALMPKSVSLVKESTEKFVASSQEIFGLSVKTGEAMSAMMKQNFEAANETVVTTVNTVKAAAKKTK